MTEINSDPRANSMERREFLRLLAGASGVAFLADCGALGLRAAAAAVEGGRPPIGREPARITVLEYAGDDDPHLYRAYTKTYPKPVFSFMNSDEQGIGKVRAGYSPDVVHPCTGSLLEWLRLDVLQPWDTKLLPNFKLVNPALARAGNVSGKQYLIPIDWGFQAPMYRGDQVKPQQNSYNILYDERYKGKIAWYDDPTELVAAGYVHGFANPWAMTSQQLTTVKNFLISKKKVVRTFWSSDSDLQQSFEAGDVWIATAWPDQWVAAKKKGINAIYMKPREGRMAWLCGFVLMKTTKSYYHDHKFVNAWLAPASAIWEMNNFAFGRSTTHLDLKKVDPLVVKGFNLANPSILREPHSHVFRTIKDRPAYNAAWAEIKAA